MSDVMTEVDGLKTVLEGMKRRIEKSEESISKFEGDISNMKTCINGLSDQLKTFWKWYLSRQDKQNEEEMSELHQDEEHVTGGISEREKKITSSERLGGQKDRKVSSIENRLSEWERKMEKVIGEIRKIEERLETCVVNFRKMEELDERMAFIEKERREKENERMPEAEIKLQRLEMEKTGLEIQKMEAFEDRLFRMEKERKNDIERLKAIKTELSSIASRIESLEKKQEREPVGFAAHLPVGRTPIITPWITVKDFTNVVTNKGNHYNPSTGEFIAPVDGLYVTTLTHKQSGSDGGVCLKVWHCRGPGVGGGRMVEVCVSRTVAKENDSCTGMGLVYMGAGSMLCVKGWMGGEVKWPSGFACFLVR